MKILHLVGGMVFVFFLSNGTVQPMLSRGVSFFPKGGSKKSLASMFGNLSLKATPKAFSFQPKFKQPKNLFSKDYPKISQFYRPNYAQKRWFSETNGGEFDGVHPDADLRMLKRCQLRALAEQLKCSEQQVQLRIEQDHEQMIRELIEQNIEDIDMRDSEGRTPIISAMHYRNYTALKVLLEKKADPNKSDLEERVPLDFAVYNNEINFLRMLLEAGANPNIARKIIEVDEQGVVTEYLVTTLRIAVERGYFDCVNLLLQCGANPEYPTKEYKKFLIDSAREDGNDDIADLLEIYPLYGV
jgi:ankyrin repeat protein